MSTKQLRPNANLNHESADEWYDSLGYHVTSDDGRSSIAHPICDIDDVDTYEPSGPAEEKLLQYAREAADAAHAVEAALEEAVEAYHAGDLAAVEAALDTVSGLESEYGDDPAAQSMRRRLIKAVSAEAES